MPKAELYENVWGLPYSDNANALFTAVSRLNKKLDDSKADVTITYERGAKATHLKVYRIAVPCRKPSFMKMCGVCRIPTTQMHCLRRFHGSIKNSMIAKPM